MSINASDCRPQRYIEQPPKLPNHMATYNGKRYHHLYIRFLIMIITEPSSVYLPFLHTCCARISDEIKSYSSYWDLSCFREPSIILPCLCLSEKTISGSLQSVSSFGSLAAVLWGGRSIFLKVCRWPTSPTGKSGPTGQIQELETLLLSKCFWGHCV